jgi:hypothetical protein
MNSRTEQETKMVAIDRVLAAEEGLIPSSGFLTAVMERINQEAAAPPPIPFPWKRAIPGMVLAAAVLGWCGFELARAGWVALQDVLFTPPHLSADVRQALQPVGWVAMALFASLLSWLLSRRLTGRSGLL